MACAFTIYQYAPVIVGNTYGEIPLCTYNEITQKFEAVVNTRGLAYAARNRKMYRKDKRKI